MGFLDSLNLPTLAEVNAERRATPKGAEPSRLQVKDAKRKDECKDAGILPPSSMDDRAFGPVYLRLAHSQRIRQCGTATRLKGHGTAGARVWEIA